jgi:acyl carrier protein
MTNEKELHIQIRNFVIESFLMGDASSMLPDQDSFLESGTIDSTGVLEVVTWLEETFNIKVADTDLIPENLDSVHNLAKYVQRKSHAT